MIKFVASCGGGWRTAPTKTDCAAALFFLCLALALTACATPAPPTATDTPTPITRATLPPPWTPTFTPSPAPPTATDTPTQPPPTLAAADICDGFEVTQRFSDGARFAHDADIPLFFGVAAVDVTVRFVATQRYTGENLGIEVPGGQMFGMNLAVARLPGHGLYDWRVSVFSPVYGDICARAGYFFAAPPAADEA